MNTYFFFFILDEFITGLVINQLNDDLIKQLFPSFGLRVLFNSFNLELRSLYKSNSEIVITNSINHEHDYASSLAINNFLAQNLSNTPSKAINELQSTQIQSSINKTPQTPFSNFK